MLKSRPTRILMTADTLSGVWNFALELASALRVHDIEVHLATLGPLPSDDQQRQASAVSNLTLYGTDCRLEWMPDAWPDVERSLKWLERLARDLRPDVVHLSTYTHGNGDFAGAPVVITAHSCVTTWYEAVRGHAPGPEWDRYHQAVGEGIRAADLVVAPTRAYAESIRRLYAPPRLRVIYNARDPGLFAPGTKEPIILAAGRVWDDAKNLALLAAAAPGLPWPVEVAGETTHPDGHTVQLPGVRLLGELPPQVLARHLANASIFVHPANYEPFGLRPLEAALSGCALVLGDIPSLREVWSDAALYVPTHDADALRREITRLATQPRFLTEMVGRARARGRRYRPAAMARSYLRTYEFAFQSGRATATSSSSSPSPDLQDDLPDSHLEVPA